MDANATNNPSSEARRGQQRTSRYSTQVAGALVAAFTISALYTVISTLSGVMHGANNPILWIFYVVGFGLAALALMDRSWTWWIVSSARQCGRGCLCPADTPRKVITKAVSPKRAENTQIDQASRVAGQVLMSHPRAPI